MARHGISSESAGRARRELRAGGPWTLARALLREVASHPAAWWGGCLTSEAAGLLEEEVDCCDSSHAEDGSNCTEDTGCRALAADEREVEEWLLDLEERVSYPPDLCECGHEAHEHVRDGTGLDAQAARCTVCTCDALDVGP